MLLEPHHQPDTCEPVSGQPTRKTSQIAVESDMTIGMAVGIVMHRYAMTGERALAYLVNVASRSNINLPALAHQIVDEANGPARGAD